MGAGGESQHGCVRGIFTWRREEFAEGGMVELAHAVAVCADRRTTLLADKRVAFQRAWLERQAMNAGT